MCVFELAGVLFCVSHTPLVASTKQGKGASKATNKTQVAKGFPTLTVQTFPVYFKVILANMVDLVARANVHESGEHGVGACIVCPVAFSCAPPISPCARHRSGQELPHARRRGRQRSGRAD